MEAIRSRPLWNDHYDNHVTGLRLSGTAAREPLERWTRSVTPVASGPQPGYHGVPVEEIARLAGHASLRMTEVIYRRELRPVITTGAEVMDQIFDLSKSDVPVQLLSDKGLAVVRVALEGCYHRRLPVRLYQPCVLGDVALGHDKNDLACSPIVH